MPKLQSVRHEYCGDLRTQNMSYLHFYIIAVLNIKLTIALLDIKNIYIFYCVWWNLWLIWWTFPHCLFKKINMSEVNVDNKTLQDLI